MSHVKVSIRGRLKYGNGKLISRILLAQTIRRLPLLAGVPSLHLGHSMWVSWWTMRGLGRFFSGFLLFSPTINSIARFLHTPLVDPGGPVVIILASGSEVRGFDPSRGLWIFQSVKILISTSFGREVKSWLPYRRFTAGKRI